MTGLIVVYGAGGHGKVVAEVLAACGQKIEGFIDDKVSLAGSKVFDLPVFAAAEWLRSHSGAQVALGIGDNVARERAANRIKQNGCALLTVVHPSAVVARSARIDEGAAIMPVAVLNPDCEIGEGAIINTGAIVEHDVRIGRFAHLSPNSATGGGAQIGSYAHIGMGASVLPLQRVGARSVIGAGAVVVSDIPEGEIAYGIPAKVTPTAKECV
ncbi:MAG: acetyltransferase [Acidobacteria bacterium]|nr:MAG: acetyltransferase [Acidobacteriota bacterium]PYY19710.1 MAG: acetyltransferase [Acidobacteriota bacterium]